MSDSPDFATVHLFLAPAASLTTLQDYLLAKGWHREPDRTGANTNQPAPLFVSWSETFGDGEIDYTYELEWGLRQLTIRGTDATQLYQELGAILPTLRSADIQQRLQSDDPSAIRLGLRIASQQREGQFASAVIALRQHDDPAIRDLAQAVLFQAGQELIGPLVESADPAILFSATPDVRYRRQILRWLGTSIPTLTPRLLQVLETALTDPDWEVQATAMVLAARFSATTLAQQVQSCAFAEGPIPQDLSILKVAQKIVVQMLRGHAIPQPAPTASPQHHQYYRLYTYLLGPAIACDQPSLWVQSLTQPLPTDLPMPAEIPSAIQDSPTGYQLAGENLPLCWVPPISHWLGADFPGLRVPNPIRRHHPTQGFFISESVFAPPTQTVSRSPLRPSPYTCTWQQAWEWCDRLSQETELSVRLPTADEWEMSARGPDGRRFPWGNGRVAVESTTSPWGLKQAFGTIPEWTHTRSENDVPIICGRATPIGCGARAIAPSSTATCAFRIVVDLP